MQSPVETTWGTVLSSTTAARTAFVCAMIGFFESRSFRRPWIYSKWQLSPGDSLLELGLLVSHMVRSRKSFLPLGYPGIDIFGRVQGNVSSLDDDGLSRNRLGLDVVKEGMEEGL